MAKTAHTQSTRRKTHRKKNRWEACRWNASSTTILSETTSGHDCRRTTPRTLFVFDHNRDHLVAWGDTVYGDKDASKYVDGLAFHWYAGGLNRDLDGAVALRRRCAYEKFPSAKLLPSEGCNCPGVKDSDLLRSERYAHDMLRVLKSGACGWVDWNLLLDYTGGPNHLGNDCDAPIHAKRNFDGVVVQSYLDVISHFSKHILPGSRRVQTDVRGAFDRDAQVTEARASVGFELTMWPCEGPPSSPTPRQNWRLTNETFLEMVDHTQKDNKWKQYCVGEVNDPNLKTLSLVSCQWGREHAGAATGKFAFDGGKLRETDSNTCLGYASTCEWTARLWLWEIVYSALLHDGARFDNDGWAVCDGGLAVLPGRGVRETGRRRGRGGRERGRECGPVRVGRDGDLVLRSIGPHSINTFVVREVDGGGGGGWGGAHGRGGYSGFGGGGSGGWGEWGGEGGGGDGGGGGRL